MKFGYIFVNESKIRHKYVMNIIFISYWNCMKFYSLSVAISFIKILGDISWCSFMGFRWIVMEKKNSEW
jgi:hypothetical protein